MKESEYKYMKDAFDKPIDSFSGEYRWLSNFYHAPITYNGVEYISTEVAYQASKACDDETRKKFIGLNSADAKKTWTRYAACSPSS